MNYSENDRLLREYLQQVLEEDAYKRNTGLNFDVKDDILKYVNDKSTPDYYFTMTSINKVGINPRSPYDTPIGIYTYPLNSKYYKMLIGDSLPFVSEASHCTILKLIDSGLLVVSDKKTLGRLTEKQNDDLKKKATQILYPDISEQEMNDCIESADVSNIHRLKNFDAQLFGFTYILTKEQGPVAWNSLLRKLGFNVVQDPGYGIIHPSEPEQCVFLNKNACKIIESFNTATIRRDTSLLSKQKYETLIDLLTVPSAVGSLTNSTIKICQKLIDSFDSRKLKAVLMNSGLSKHNGWAYRRAIRVLLDKGIKFYDILEKMTPESISNVVYYIASAEMPDMSIMQWLVQSSQPANVETALAKGILSSYVWKELIHRAENEFNLPDVFGLTLAVRSPKISKPVM